jgi:cytidine deaminase
MDSKVLAQMTAAAKQAATQAYSPYSRFQVGVAILADNNKIYVGCNVENAAYGSVLCAEINAVGSAVVDGVETIKAVLLYGPGNIMITPCGNCRQVLNEFGANIAIISVAGDGKVTETSLAKLLPHAFGPHNFADQGDGQSHSQ